MKQNSLFKNLLNLVIVSASVLMSNHSVFAFMLDTGWTVQTSGTSGLYAVKSVSQNVAWVAGGAGGVRRTTNAGETWLPANIPVPDGIYTLTGLDGNTALVASYSSSFAKVWKTTNGGTSWTVRDSVVGSFINFIHVFGTTNGYLQGDPVGGMWVLKRTTNGGQSWVSAATLPAGPSEASWNNGMMWLNETYGWFVTNGAHIYRTTDGGVTWQVLPGCGGTTSIWFNSLNLGLALGGSTGVCRSTDTGSTWISLSNQPSGIKWSLSGISGTSEFWMTTTTGIYYTNDSGNTWTNSPPHGYPGSAMHISIVTNDSGTFGWALGSAGTVYRYRRTNPVVGVPPNTAPLEFILFQNYPNPFNPTTEIRYQISKVSHIILKIFDVNGKETIQLLDEKKSPGVYTLIWDATGLPSGVYVYRLNAGRFVSTRKMILIK